MGIRVAVLLAALASASASAAFAQTGENVLLAVNSESPASIQIAEHYAKVRRVPERNVVRLQTRGIETISRADYEATIETPISQWLARQRLQDQVLYIVLTKGIPLRIEGTGGLSGTTASVDSELTLLYRRMAGTRAPVFGRLDNPYFLGDAPIARASRFSRVTSDVYLVTRLDGFTVEDVLSIIDRGANPVRDGQIVLDQKGPSAERGGDHWLAQTAERLTAMNQGPRVQLEGTRAVAAVTGPVLGYFSWGSNDPANQRRQMGMQFANGSIGGMFVSTDARTFREPGAGWRPAQPGSASSGQSLVGDLIREGITGVSGHVAEPFLDAIVRPQILFPAYLSGLNLAESFYLAMPYLSWQGVVIGDPLCAPFMSAPLASDQIHKGLDAETELPALFAKRRLASLQKQDLKVDGLKLLLKAQSLEAQGRDVSEVVSVLVRATAAEPRLTSAHAQLAQAAEARSDFDEAVARYRAILAVESDNLIALNNLAYVLVERKSAAREALPLAERAYRLSGQAPAVADTLGWVHFKLGDEAAALPFLDRAARLAPKNIDILIHAATVHASLNSMAQARKYLEAAVKLDPKIEERPDVKALRSLIR